MFPVGTALWVVMAALGCGETPTRAAEPIRYESEHFVVLDYAGIAPSLADSFARRLESDYERVATFLPNLDPPASIVANVRPGWALPSMTIGAAELTQWTANLRFDYNVHLLIHILTGYANSQFLEEGLAVYGTEVLVAGSGTVEPYRGQVPHAWMALYAIHGSVIPFDVLYAAQTVSYEPTGSIVDASAWQFFVHAGSFTRWVFDEFPPDTWWRLYDGEPPESVLGLDLAETEAQWVAAARTLYPDPAPCREALGSVGVREGFWCSLAEGRVARAR